MDPIEGAGGGKAGAKPYVPREDPNTLQSNAIARVIDVLGEGPIRGLVDGTSSIFFDETPMVDPASGTANFQGARLWFREGTPDQPHVGEFPAIEAEVQVGVEATRETPVIRTINDPDVDRLRITVSIPALYQITDQGDMLAHEVDYAIEVRSAGSSAWEVLVPGSGTYEPIAGTNTGVAVSSFRVTVQAAVKPAGTAKVDTMRSGDNRYLYKDRSTHDWYVQYRKVGDGNWKVLADEQVTVDASSSPLRTFTKTGLEPGVYEVHAVEGTLKQLERNNAAMIRLAGKNTAPYERDYVVALPQGGAPWDVRLRRISDDETTEKKQSRTFWARYTEIQDHKLTYPDTAYVAVTVNAEQFAGRVPQRAYEIYGLRIKIPSNYDPHTRTYSGAWNGTFTTGWTDNPAWIFYDLCTNLRYGLGKWVDGQTVDKWALYAIARYCDELVPDGAGGMESRYRCNVVINTRDEAFRVLQLIASVCRSKAFWGGNMITLAQDRPKEPSIIVSPANVLGGEFSYSGTGLKARHTVCFVTWNDPEDFYRPAIEVVEDQDAVRQYGWRQTDLVAFGCTSRGQAVRMGKWLLDTEQHETETVTYRASFDHMIAAGQGVQPGDIILIADPAYAQVRYGGRIAKVLGGKSLRLDAQVGAGPGHLLSVVLPDGTVAERSFSLEGVSDTLVLDEQFTPLPLDGAMWAITAPSVAPRPFQVLAVRETEPNVVEVTALRHDANKFDRVERDIPGKPQAFSRQTKGPLKPVSNLAMREQLYKVNTSLLTRLVISWAAPKDERVNFYEVQYRLVNGSWSTRQTFDTSLTLEGAEAGSYHIAVYSRSAVAGRSVATQLYNVPVLGKTAPPGDVQGLTAHAAATGVELRWNEVTDLDLVGYEVREGLSWDTGTVLASNLVSTALYVPLNDAQPHYFRVRAVDQLGNYSINVAMVPAKVVAPPAPTRFEVRPQAGDRLLFAWEPATSETGVWYEVRYGETWGLGRKVTLTGGSSASVLFPLAGDHRFWIKAYSRVGLYSDNALFHDAAVALMSDRNVVLDYDNANDGGAGLYPGTHVGMAPGSDATLVLSGTEGGFSSFGEHSFEVDLGQVVTARNWMEFQAIQFAADLTWDAWVYSWDSPDSAIAWVPVADEGEVVVSPFIMRKTGALSSEDLVGFPLNGSTDSYDGGVSAFEADGVVYEPARYGQGLLVENTTAVGWDVSIPTEFALAFKVALRGRSLRNSVFLQLGSADGYHLVLGYDANAGCFYLEEPGVNRIEASLALSADDFLSLGIAQSTTTRTLFLASEVFGMDAEASLPLAPLGAFNRLQLHR